MKGLLGGRWCRALMVMAPLVLLIVLAVATSNLSAISCTYSMGCEGGGAPPTVYGISDQLLYVADGRASDVAIIDVGTMSIVDSVPVPNQPTPAGIHSWNPDLMNWEIHGAMPSKAVDGKRQYVYAVGALSGGSYDSAGNFRLADYEMYKVDVGTKATVQEIPLQGAGAPVNPVGFCGLEYNLNDENSSTVVATNMNAANATLGTVLHDPVSGDSIDLSGVRGSGQAVENGGLTLVDIASGTYSSFISTDTNANMESSVCGIAWNATGDRAFASQQFEPLVAKINWTTQTTDGTIPAFAGSSLLHQAASDKARNRYYATSSSGYVYVYDMSTDAEVGAINVRALTGTSTNDIHGVEVAPGNPNVLYVTSRYTPYGSDNMELVVDISDLSAPTLIGVVGGLAQGACGVYAIADKTEYYKAANPTGVGNEMLFVANGRASNVAVIDVGSMSIVDSVPVPNQPTPAGLHSWNPNLMNWEIHGVIPSKDRTSVYAVGALSGGSYAGAPLPDGSNFRLADYEMYQVNTATKALEREIPLQGTGAPVNPVGFCGLEYNLNDENSSTVVVTNMNAANATLATVLHDPVTGDPIDVGGVRGSGDQEDGGLTLVDIGTGTYSSFISTDLNGNNESSVCGIAWNATGDRAFASQQFEPLVAKIDWNTRTTDGSIPAFATSSLMHQAASDKARGRYYATSSSGYVYVYDMNTDAEIDAIDIRRLAGSNTSDIHGVEVSPSDPDIIYVTARSTPDYDDNTVLVIDVADLWAPRTLGSVNGLADGACGVYAIDKSEYYGQRPSLVLGKVRTYWNSYADYLAHDLSVDYSVGNATPPERSRAGAHDVRIVGSNNTNGVAAITPLPLNVGDIGPSSSAGFTLHYSVPAGTAGFNSVTYATAQSGATIFAYPGPYPGP